VNIQQIIEVSTNHSSIPARQSFQQSPSFFVFNMSHHIQLRKPETVDLSPFTKHDGDHPTTQSGRLTAAHALVEALHALGFVKIKGHGLTTQEVREAFTWTKRLFDLPTTEKMKAPRPPGNMPHRGYSGLGQEKVYSPDDVQSLGDATKAAQELRKVTDFKESYEIGSEHDDQQQNIWLPDDVLPQFRTYMTSLYERLDKVVVMILEAISLGLGLDAEAHAELVQLHSSRHCQLRLLHYPGFGKEKLQTVFARLPAHTDWG